MNLWETKLEISFEAAATADELLLEQGLERWSVYEDVIVRRAWIQGLFDTEVDAKEACDALSPLLAECSITLVGAPCFKEVQDQDWKDSYKAHFKPWHFGRLHWVPEWERGRYLTAPGEVVLWLDPGLAFGTGNHETTRLCCERLVTAHATLSKPETWRVMDAGCGSGILALSAALLGAGSVEGFDNDPEAVRVSGENARLNGLEARVRFFEGDLVTGLQGRQFDFLMANILADVLMRFADVLIASVAPGGSLVLSGILAQECPKVRECFCSRVPGWKVESRQMGEWADLLLCRP